MSSECWVPQGYIERIVYILEQDSDIRDEQIDEIVDAWYEDREPDVSTPDIVWALRDAEAYREKKAYRFWAGQLGDTL